MSLIDGACYLVSVGAILISLTAIALVLRKLPLEQRLKVLETALEDVRSLIAFLERGGIKPPDASKEPSPD